MVLHLEYGSWMELVRSSCRSELQLSPSAWPLYRLKVADHSLKPLAV